MYPYMELQPITALYFSALNFFVHLILLELATALIIETFSLLDEVREQQLERTTELREKGVIRSSERNAKGSEQNRERHKDRVPNRLRKYTEMVLNRKKLRLKKVESQEEDIVGDVEMEYHPPRGNNQENNTSNIIYIED